MPPFLHKSNFLFRTIYPECWWKINNAPESTIYLTFDDGPIPDVTEFVLEQLDKWAAQATFFCIVLDGKLRGEDGTEDGVGSIVGWEGLFQDNYQRQVRTVGGVAGGTLALFLYAEMDRAKLFDEEIINLLKESVLGAAGKPAD